MIKTIFLTLIIMIVFIGCTADTNPQQDVQKQSEDKTAYQNMHVRDVKINKDTASKSIEVTVWGDAPRPSLIFSHFEEKRVNAVIELTPLLKEDNNIVEEHEGLVPLNQKYTIKNLEVGNTYKIQVNGAEKPQTLVVTLND